MNILVTGAKGFVGKNLVAALEAIRDGKDGGHPELTVECVFACDRDTTREQLDLFCDRADFVFHLAGVNRAEEETAFMEGNCGFLGTLLAMLEARGNACPVVLSSSIRASCGESAYGMSKLAGERLLQDYGRSSGARVLIYRLPNLFGKWCNPHYNSVVATFCHDLARDLPIAVLEPARKLKLVYIDDLIQEWLLALKGEEHRCGDFCYVPVTHEITVEELARLLRSFREQSDALLLPQLPEGSLTRKLYATYLSYLPAERVSSALPLKEDARGAFAEFLKTKNCGQFSVNITKPGAIKGNHWHQSKWEVFLVVSGHGLICQRQIHSREILEFEVTAHPLEAVRILPGYVHSIRNLSSTEDLVTLMWASEVFDPEHPDTFYEEVRHEQIEVDDNPWHPAGDHTFIGGHQVL